MSYEKTTWQIGDVITSEKLNHLEDGVDAASSPIILHLIPNEPFNLFSGGTIHESKEYISSIAGRPAYASVPVSDDDDIMAPIAWIGSNVFTACATIDNGNWLLVSVTAVYDLYGEVEEWRWVGKGALLTDIN